MLSHLSKNKTQRRPELNLKNLCSTDVTIFYKLMKLETMYLLCLLQRFLIKGTVCIAHVPFTQTPLQIMVLFGEHTNDISCLCVMNYSYNKDWWLLSPFRRITPFEWQNRFFRYFKYKRTGALEIMYWRLVTISKLFINSLPYCF